MIQSDKELLLKDLCARLPYGIKVKLGDNPNIFELQYRIKFAVMYGDSDKLEDILDITNIKPYLFPLSSMTEKQKTSHNFLKYSAHANPVKLVDFYNKHHLDYRGLIPMGLANDATNKNIY